MSQVTFNFTEQWQDAILGYSLKNYEFFLGIKTYVDPRWFEKPYNQELARQLFDLHSAVQRPITVEELKNRIRQIHAVDNNAFRAYTTQIDQCLNMTDHVGLDLLSRDMTAWIRMVKVRNLLVSAEQLYNKQQYGEAASTIERSIKDVNSTTFMADDAVSFKDPVAFLHKKELELKECLTLGHPDFDELVRGKSKPDYSALSGRDYYDLSNLTYGGLVRGDTTVLIGPSNAGKTSSIITIIAANVKMRRKVLFIAHEQKRDDLKTRILSSYCNMNKDELGVASVSDKDRSILEVGAAEIDKYLTYIHHMKPTEMYAENVVAMIERRQEQMKAQTGSGYDLLVVDYPGKLRLKHMMGSKISKYEIIGEVYNMFFGLAGHYNFHTILPVQTNREGMKANKGDSEHMVDMDHVAESISIVQAADNVISINRSNQNEQDKVIKYYLAKCRLNTKGTVFVSETRFDRCRSHGLGLRSSIAYTSFNSTADKVGKSMMQPQIGGSVSTDTVYSGFIKAQMQTSGVSQLPSITAMTDEEWLTACYIDENEIDDGLLPPEDGWYVSPAKTTGQ